jgi:(p)ppGpp synthase/HD superfamily hydrolase
MMEKAMARLMIPPRGVGLDLMIQDSRKASDTEMLEMRFEEALVYAARVHAGQKRKGTEVPYVSHLLMTAGIALEHGADEDEAIAALLHDAAEDQGGRPRLEDIRARFGDRVAAIVEACTDTFDSPKPPWRPRKEASIARVAGETPSARLVSASDKLANARSIILSLAKDGEAAWERFTGKKAGTLWYYRALVGAFRAAGPSPLVDELDRAVTDLESLADSPRNSRPPARP